MAACWASSSSSWAWENGLCSEIQPVMNFNKEQHHHNSARDSSPSPGMGLRLGKRTYFEDSTPPANTPTKTSSLTHDHQVPAHHHQHQHQQQHHQQQKQQEVPISGLVSVARKKQRGPSQPAVTPSCQVEGCNADLSGSKGYHRRHRVCEVHSKTPKNMVGGIEQRFCQQCSRFHVLGEFDEGKRSCRRRLAGHNERRRKPPPSETFALHSALLGGSPIFQADPNRSLAVQQHHQHLLDGTFIVSQNSKSSWPDSTSLLRPLHHESSQIQQVFHPGSFFLKSINRDSIASQGVYQFLKCNAVAAAASSTNTRASSPSSSSITNALPMSVPVEPGIVTSAGALSLLSPEQWSSSPSKMFSSSSSPSIPLLHNNKLDNFHLQLHDSYHHHQQQQQQQQQHQLKFGLNEFLQYQKPLEANLVYDA